MFFESDFVKRLQENSNEAPLLPRLSSKSSISSCGCVFRAWLRAARNCNFCARSLAIGVVLGGFPLFLVPANAQEEEVIEEAGGEVEEIVVTGSRILRDPVYEASPVSLLDKSDLERSGLTNLGDILRSLPIAGSAPSSRFNVPGNSGFPQDGSGIGAGSVHLSLRNIDSKRTLVLVDGRRWIAGASASGVPGTVDLNSLPDNVIQRIEILQDGASAIYGSDVIGGVVNIVTDREFEGLKMDFQTGNYLAEGDGGSQEIGLKIGGGNESTHIVFSASYRNELGVETAARSRSAFPNPDATSCDVPGSFCSSFTPQGRFVFGPNFAGGASITINSGVLNDGGANIPNFDPDNPTAGDFHAFTSADRFNYNGPGFNYLRTPNQRKNIFVSLRHSLDGALELFGTTSFTSRSSATKGAPEPLCFGFGCGSRITENFFISAENPYNPFGIDLSTADGTLAFFGRRPLESGPRLFFQETNTYFLTLGVRGELALDATPMSWEAYASYGDNQGFQEKYNSHNAAKLQVALGDPAICEATPGCVPFNFFGGQGPDGIGSITKEMLDYVRYTQRDFSEQTLRNFAFNVTGGLFDFPAGEVRFATGVEYRDHNGSFRPDPIAERAETAGIPSGPTDGAFSATEYYGELSMPLMLDGVRFWELNVAARVSDYSTFGSQVTYKATSLFKVAEDFSLRGSVSTGFRSPGIGELFGGAAREDFLFLDPCSDVLGQYGSANGGRNSPQPDAIINNCAALGVPTSYVQTQPQLSARSAGNRSLGAESSQSMLFGAVWGSRPSGGWTDGISISIDVYRLSIDNAVQGRSPSDVLRACIDTLDPQFCDLVPRQFSGALGVIDNQLQNIGSIAAHGLDLALRYEGPDLRIGTFSVSIDATQLSKYEETVVNVDGSETTADRTGKHTDETFQRAFPELRWTGTVGWLLNEWTGSLTLRWTQGMELDGGSSLDSAMFADVRVGYRPEALAEGFLITAGLNNALNTVPPVCLPCGVIGMSAVVHDLPGRIGYLRVSYQK